MNRQVLGAIGGMAALAAAVAWTVAGSQISSGQRSADERPELALVTSLPLIFSESFGLAGGGSAMLTRLDRRYRVQPIGVADAASLRGKSLLLMAHPRAQPPEVLVELDHWVRSGGAILLLADPKLDWPSDRPLGDRLRPPPAFADTGLLAHWGLKLAGAAPEGTIGVLAGNGACRIDEDGALARCRIGRGRATVIADADFLNVDNPDSPNLDIVVNELDRLESR